MQLYAKLKWDEKRQIETGRQLEFIVPKAEPGWWPRLLKSETKAPWIKIDFDKWKDEDEKDEGRGWEDNDFGDGFPGMSGIDFSQFGGGSGDMDGMGELGGFDEEDEISDHGE